MRLKEVITIPRAIFQFDNLLQKKAEWFSVKQYLINTYMDWSVKLDVDFNIKKLLIKY